MAYSDPVEKLIYDREYAARPEVKARRSIYDRKYFQENKDWRHHQMRQRHLQTRYSLSVKEWSELFKAQGSCCAICKSCEPNSMQGWCTDHDHKDGRVRGILCMSCNIALGCAKDNTLVLHSMIRYLENSNEYRNQTSP